MSYANMDHAGWVESNIAATKARKPTAHQSRQAANGKGMHAAPDKLSPFQARVMDILGMVGGGIYNAPISWPSVVWDYGRGLSLIWHVGNGLATFDFNQLTMLVFLCHEARIRCEIEDGGPRMLRLSFWQRSHEGMMGQRHPSLAEAVEAFRQYLPLDHRIIYKPGAREEQIGMVK